MTRRCFMLTPLVFVLAAAPLAHAAPAGWAGWVLSAPYGEVTTVVGGPPAPPESLAHPVAAIEGPDGRVWIADNHRHAIFEQSPGGTLRRVSGGGVPGYRDGAADTALWDRPADLALDADGGLLVADEGNHVVRKLTPDGRVETIAGTGQAGEQDGPARTSSFGAPASLAYAPGVGLAILDRQHKNVRLLTPKGTVKTLAGHLSSVGMAMDGVRKGTSFESPRALRWHPEGYWLVADAYAIRKLSPKGLLETTWTSDMRRALQSLTISVTGGPIEGLAIGADGTVTLGDNRALYRRGMFGMVQVVAGVRAPAPAVPGPDFVADRDGLGPEARFAGELNLAAARDGGVLVADTLNRSIRKLEPGGAVRTIARAVPPAKTERPDSALRMPQDVCFDRQGRMFIADTGRHRVLVRERDGRVRVYAGQTDQAGRKDGPAAVARLEEPAAIAIDAAGRLYVADASRRLRVIAPDGTVSTLAGSGQAGARDGQGAQARFDQLTDVAVGPGGTVWVVDGGAHRLATVSAKGHVSTWWRAPASQIELGADQIAFDTLGRVLMIDTYRSERLYRFGADRQPQPILGRDDATDEQAPSALQVALEAPEGLAVDGVGRIFVADTHHNRVLRLDPDGRVGLIAGRVDGEAGAAIGPHAIARLSWPRGLAFGADGALYVADAMNHAVRRVPVGR